MAKDASVAPKERVNIRYKPATGDAKEEVELPLKMLVMGDFTQGEDDTPLEDRQRINIDKDNFNEVMRSLALSVDLSVDNKISGNEDEKLSVSLDFASMKGFEPEEIIKQVPELRKMIELRQALMALKGPLGNVPAFRKKLQEILDDEGARKQLLTDLGL